LKIGGLQKFSLIDYPGKISTVIFTQGCNLRCPYCHNPELVLPEEFNNTINPDYVIDILKSRIGKIDCVTVTGGEPTIQENLLPFLNRIKNLNLKIKLDTNGTFTERIREILINNLVDFIAMDIKAPCSVYNKLSGVPVNTDSICESIDCIINSGVNYQFRTTLVPGLHTDKMVEELNLWMHSLNAIHIYQDFVSTKVLNKNIINKKML
jgi:pyruvate formate lyase activating enzyme